MSKRRPPPLLPRAQLLEAINSNPNTAKSTRQHPSAIFDGHLHLWETPEIIEKLDWAFEGKEVERATRAIRSNHGAARYMQGVQNLSTLR